MRRILPVVIGIGVLIVLGIFLFGGHPQNPRISTSTPVTQSVPQSTNNGGGFWDSIGGILNSFDSSNDTDTYSPSTRSYPDIPRAQKPYVPDEEEEQASQPAEEPPAATTDSHTDDSSGNDSGSFGSAGGSDDGGSFGSSGGGSDGGSFGDSGGGGGDGGSF
jgi:hypothetical protein